MWARIQGRLDERVRWTRNFLKHFIRPRTWASGLLFACLIGTCAAASYFYDGNGRLRVANNDAGQAAQYVYDNLGNLTRIDRVAANALAIFNFSPERGPEGGIVTVQGQGFSSVAANNVVAFNGVTAQVLSATRDGLIKSAGKTRPANFRVPEVRDSLQVG